MATTTATITTKTSFSLNDVEQDRAQKWRHPCCGTKRSKAYKPEFIFAQSSGIAVSVWIRCTLCGVRKELTDYESW